VLDDPEFQAGGFDTGYVGRWLERLASTRGQVSHG
jgi:hypothetical protein